MSGHRRDIDGLRAFAVLSVVLYHLQAPGFAGGFAGVDVFFVISGFLIGGHISEEIAGGRFSLVAFYERRIRRIFPALYAMLALVLPAGALILFKPEFQKLVPTAISAVALVANVSISRTLGGYWGDPARASPLLHTWSLAVEEQFYLLFPVLMLGLARFAGGRYRPWLAGLALLSFAASVVAARVAPTEDFYLPQFRAWELLLGAVLATGSPRLPRSGTTRSVLALAGLALIAAADLLLNRETPFPSEYALLPCGGAALILFARCGPASLPGRLLGAPPVRAIGLWSYSLYLVHWPLLAFARYYLDAPLPAPLKASLLAASIALAALSWRFVEQPFRGRGKLFSTRQLYVVAAGAAVLLLGGALGLRGAYGARHMGAERFFPPPTVAQNACWDIPPDVAASRSVCRLGAAGPPDAILWGDSHARALIPAVAAAFAAHGDTATVFALGGCPPVLDLQVRQGSPEGPFEALKMALERWPDRCPRHNAQALRWIAAHRIRVVILAAYWIAYADTAKAPSAVANHITVIDPKRPWLTDEAAIFETNLAATLAALQRLGVRTYLVEDAPQQDVDVPIALASDVRLGRGPRAGISRAAYDVQQAVVTGIFERLRPRYGFTLLRPQGILCAEGHCAIIKDGRTLYRDDEHLTAAGAIVITPALSPVWADHLDQGPDMAGGPRTRHVRSSGAGRTATRASFRFTTRRRSSTSMGGPTRSARRLPSWARRPEPR